MIAGRTKAKEREEPDRSGKAFRRMLAKAAPIGKRNIL
jgi:hypothetical protein